MAKTPLLTLNFRGDKALSKALDELAGSINRRVIKGATGKAMKPVVKSAKEILRPFDRTGQLRKSIGMKQKKYPSGVMWTGVGPRKGFKIQTEEFGPVNPVNYAHLIEFGTVRADARPFLRPAYDKNRTKVRGILNTELWAGIIKETNKARAKSGGKR